MPGNMFQMLTLILTSFLLIAVHTISSIHSSIIPPPPPFNFSHFLYPKVSTFTESNTPPPQPPHFLQSVLDTIAKKEKWALEDIRVSQLDAKKAKYSSGLRYELRVRFGKAEIVLKMYEELSVWKELVALRKNGISSFEALAKSIASKAVIDSFKLEGPFELRVTRDDDQLSLMLPLNTSHSGLRRMSVGEGITVEIKGSEEISLSHPSVCHLPHGLLISMNIFPAFCKALPPVRIMGSASLVAYRNQRPNTPIQTAFTSKDAIKLLPDKCYLHRIALLERVLPSFLNERGNTLSSLGSVKTRIKALTLFRFQLQLVRDIRDNDTFWSSLAEWRTRPSVERVLLEVVASLEGEVLKPLVIKKVGPVVDTDTFAWSSLSSNLSFTKFPSVLVPPEALTLDVKW
ncbi:hypothetical protein OROMI_031819 [Orobanche minor]